MHIVLVEPEIPANTGNIARTCAVTGSSLHLVRPLGFSTDDRYLKRAGLDYWHLLDLHYHDSIEELLSAYAGAKFLFVTTRGKKFYSQFSYGPDDFLVFGRETRGLPVTLLERYPEWCARIPMINDARSLNLGNSVALVLYEALRQQGYPELG